MSIKEDSELRHVIAHIINAIRASAEGRHEVALYEIDAIEGLVMWDNEDQMTSFIRSLDMKCNMRKTKKTQKPKKASSKAKKSTKK